MAICNATVPNKGETGDALYGGRWSCEQSFVDTFCKHVGVAGNKAYWDDGFGWDDPCDTSLPLARLLNACWMLWNSAPQPEKDDYDQPILNWARRYVSAKFNDLRVACGDGTAAAIAYPAGGFVYLFTPFFYQRTVPARAGTLVHEARHMDGYKHNAKFPKGSCFGEGAEGADSNWDYQGGWMFAASYLGSFWESGQKTTPAMREFARQRANVIIDNAFEKNPGFVYKSCE